MKNLFWISALILSMLIGYSCSKKGIENDLLAGKWSIVNDSILNSSYITNLEDSTKFSGNYVGGPNDYFNFTSNGTLVVALSPNTWFSTVDSAKYKMVTSNQVEISNYFIGYGWAPVSHYINPVESRTYVISNLTSHSATLTFATVHPSSVNVSGIETEIINLKK